MRRRAADRVRRRAAGLQALAVAVPLLLGLAGRGERAEPLAYAHFRARAVALAPGALDADPWIDVAEQGARLRPWHPGFGAARADLGAIDRARRP